jgi:hypothetical protein
MNSILNLSVQQLRHAADLKEKIAALENELSRLLGSPANAVVAPLVAKASKQGGMSAPGKISAAAKPVAKKKFKMSAEAKKKISIAAKARWAKIRAAKK